MTLALAWAPGVIARPTLVEKIQFFFRSNWTFLIPILSFVVMYRLWKSLSAGRFASSIPCVTPSAFSILDGADMSVELVLQIVELHDFAKTTLEQGAHQPAFVWLELRPLIVVLEQLERVRNPSPSMRKTVIARPMPT